MANGQKGKPVATSPMTVPSLRMLELSHKNAGEPFHCRIYVRPFTGKRSAGKLARSVWNGGKTERSYLSLQLHDHLHDHLSLSMPLLEVGECVGDVRKWKNTVNHYLKFLLIDECRQF